MNISISPEKMWVSVNIVIAIIVVILLFATITVRNTVGDLADNLNCILYEHSAHRILSREDNDVAADHHEYTLPQDRPKRIPPSLRAACENLFPGSTSGESQR